MRNKMIIVALVAGFCGFLLRSAAAPIFTGVSSPATALSAVSAEARRPEAIAADWEKWEKRAVDAAGDLARSLRKTAFGTEDIILPADSDEMTATSEHEESAEFIALPGAEEHPEAVTVVRPAGNLPGLSLMAPLDKVSAPLPEWETSGIASSNVASRMAVARSATSARRGFAARTVKPRRYREIWATVTAYCPCSRCCGWQARGRTSLGGTAWVPGIAADPTALSYGTVVEVPGYGEYTVDDTGGAMRRSWRDHGRLHIDVRMKSHREARRWGRRTMKIRVYNR